MVSRTECDNAYRLIGYDSFAIVDRNELEQRIQDMVWRLGTTITNEQRMMLMNARRANTIASFESDSKEVQDDKVQCAFDQVDSAELCTKYRYFFPWKRVALWIKPIPNDDNKFICVPVKRDCHLYEKLLKTHCLAELTDIVIDPDDMLMPINVRYRHRIDYIVDPRWVKDRMSDWIVL